MEIVFFHTLDWNSHQLNVFIYLLKTCLVHIIDCKPLASVSFFYCKSGPVMCCTPLFSALGCFSCMCQSDMLEQKTQKIVCVIVGKRLFLIKWWICGRLWLKRERFLLVWSNIKCNKWNVFHLFNCSSRMKQVCICFISLINGFIL